MSLTDQAVRAALAIDKPRKLYDTDGLYLLVNPSGSKLWRFKYRYAGVEKLISLGSYPEVSLKQARVARAAARQLVAADQDPSAARREAENEMAHTFESVSRDYLVMRSKKVGPITLKDETWRLNTLLLPDLGRTPISQVKAPALLAVLRKAEARGLTDTVQRAKQMAGRIFRFGIASGLCEHDVAADLKDAIAIVPAKKHPGLTDPKKVGELLRAINTYVGQPSTVYALKLLPLIFLRSSELRGMRWDWIDWGASLIRIPGSFMKMAQAHLVPLASQAVEILRAAQQVNGRHEFVFQSYVSGKPISENTLNQALAQLGYPGSVHCPHGFRTTFNTMANELQWDADMIELQLAHVYGGVRGRYNEALKLDGRRHMMQRWADYLDTLRGAQG